MIGVDDERDTRTGHSGHQPLRRDVRVADADGGRAGRASTCWSSTCRTSAAATTRTSGRWRWRWARRRARGVAVVVLDRPNPLGGVAIEGGTVQRALRVVRRAGRGPGPPRADDRRDRAAGGRRDAVGRGALRAAARLRPDGGADARLAAGDDVRRHRAAVGDAVAEHADARHRAGLSRASACSRGPTSPRGAARRGRSRSSARRSSTATRWAAALAATQLPGVRFRPLVVPPDVPQVRAASRAAACSCTSPTAAAFRRTATGVALLAAARELAPATTSAGGRSRTSSSPIRPPSIC